MCATIIGSRPEAEMRQKFGFCEGNPPVSSGFSWQKSSDEENVFHDVIMACHYIVSYIDSWEAGPTIVRWADMWFPRCPPG